MINLSVLALVAMMLLQAANAPPRESSREGSSQDLATLKKQAEAGDVKAQVQIGLAYATGDGVTADGLEAVK